MCSCMLIPYPSSKLFFCVAVAVAVFFFNHLCTEREVIEVGTTERSLLNKALSNEGGGGNSVCIVNQPTMPPNYFILKS